MARIHVLPQIVTITAISLGACSTSGALISNAGYAFAPPAVGTLSWQSQQTERIVMQQHDYSCGAAALATMMTHYFEDPVSELDILVDVERAFDVAERDVIQAAGLSLAELGTIAQGRGYRSAAIALAPAALERLPGPVIIFLSSSDYRHFAVLREVVDGRARIADPSRGNLSLTIAELLEVWHGETLVMGREGFGVPTEHLLRADVRADVDPPRVDPLPPRLSPFIRVPR